MKRTTILLAGLALVTACGGGDAESTLTSDSALARDLNLAAQAPYTGVDSLSALEQGYDTGAVTHRGPHTDRHATHDQQHEPDVRHGLAFHERIGQRHCIGIVRRLDGVGTGDP
jgi:hypothetical protein